MQLLNTIYKSDESLKSFITEHDMNKAKAIFVQIFSAVIDEEYCKNLAALIKAELPHAYILGTTAGGVIVEGKVLDHESVISFSLFENTSLRYEFFSFDEESNVLDRIENELLVEDTKAMVIVSDGLKSESESFLKSLYERRHDIIIAGGRASDYEFKKTFVFNEEKTTENGCIVCTFSGEDLHANSDYILKWTPVGKDMVVTKAEGPIVYEIDHMPIIDVYRKYLGDDIAKDLPASCMPFPLILHKGGVLVARDPIGVLEEENALVFAGYFEEGDIVRFSFANIEELTDNLEEVFYALNQVPVEGIYIYSCAARKALLKDKIASEFNILQSLAPASGFFTFGEYFSSSDIAELLNVTTTFLFLSETHEMEPKELQTKVESDFDPIRKALTHLVKVTSVELEKLSTKDTLTQLYNRTEYLRVIKRKIVSAKRYGEPFGLILIDIDFFKKINDTYGHDVGDMVLRKFAKVIVSSVREDDFVARWGGEEFTILTGKIDEKGLVCLIEKLQKKIKEENFDPVSQLTASFGATIYRDGDKFEEIFKRADEALYYAKTHGRDRYEIR
jgi:diguanylate cyclase (GGDEF)-like protein